MSFDLTILGSGAATPTTDNYQTAHVLNVREQFYLIDCGEGTQRRLLQCGINPLKINAIFISHIHGDHTFGLAPLVSTMSMMGRERGLQIFAPYPMEEIFREQMRFMDGGDLGFTLEFQAVDTRKHEKIYETKVFEVWTIPLRHRVPTAGYHFREKMPELNVHKDFVEFYKLDIYQILAAKRGEDIALESGEVVPNSRLTYLPYQPRSYAYLSDTQYSAKAAGLVHGVDLLYHEATFSHADRLLAKQTGHSTAPQAAKVATLAEAKNLLIGHISPRYKDLNEIVAEAQAIFVNTEFAVPGRKYSI